MNDIVETLRECAEDSRKTEGDYYADQFSTDASVFDEAADEIERLRLTDEEREAIAWAAGVSDTRPSGCRTTLRSLLKRTSKVTADGRENDQ
jgi:hypothetical protein